MAFSWSYQLKKAERHLKARISQEEKVGATSAVMRDKKRLERLRHELSK